VGGLQAPKGREEATTLERVAVSFSMPHVVFSNSGEKSNLRVVFGGVRARAGKRKKGTEGSGSKR